MPVDSVLLKEDYGIEGDAHAGTVREVSLLSLDAIERMRRAASGLEIGYGAFAENIVLSAEGLHRLPVGAIIRIADTKLQIIQIGKECHEGCNISRTVGTCVMPKEGLFARVIKGGAIRVGDTCHYLL